MNSPLCTFAAEFRRRHDNLVERDRQARRDRLAEARRNECFQYRVPDESAAPKLHRKESDDAHRT